MGAPDETNSIHAAIAAGDADRVAAILAEDPAAAQARDDDGISAVMLALYHRKRELAEAIVAAGARLDPFEACAYGDEAAVSAALDADPKLTQARAPDGFALLHLAAFFGHEGLTDLLLAHGSPVDAEADNPSRVQPLHSAAAARSLPIVSKLLDAGAPVDAAQRGGFTALMSAALHGDAPMATRLLAAGADPTRAAEDGRTAIAMARAGGHETLADRLEGG